MTRNHSEEDNLNQALSTRVENNQICGYLYKKSSSRDWQKRYFETSGGYLTYYKSHKMTKLLAAVSVPQVGAIRKVGPMEDSRGVGVVFSLELKDRTYLLRANSEEEAQTWVDFLTELRDGQNSQSSSNPLNSFSESSSSLSTAQMRKSRLHVEPPATATLNKATRYFLCCFKL